MLKTFKMHGYFNIHISICFSKRNLIREGREIIIMKRKEALKTVDKCLSFSLKIEMILTIF